MRFSAIGALAAAGALGCALAQSDECTVSTAEGFDFQMSPETDFTVYWTVDTDAQEVTFQVVYDGEGWVSVGFSSTGLMVVGDAVIGLPDNGTALEYDMNGYGFVSVNENENPEISGASVTQAGSTTTLVFTRPLAPTDVTKTTLSAEEGESLFMLWAHGSGNELMYHGARGSVSLSDLFCTAELSGEDTDAEATGEDCTSSDPDYDFEVAPSGDSDELSLFWSVVGTSVSVKAVYQGTGWLGIGFSDDGMMPGSDAVVGLPDEGTAFEYDMDGYSQPVESAEQEISDATITQEGGVTTLTFVRPLEPTGDGKQALSESSPTAWLYAWGGGNEFVRHSVDGAFSLSLGSCNVGDAGGGGTTAEYAHGWLMVLGWTFCFPAGILFARFSSSFKDIGFPAHRIIQSLGTVFVIAGFITAVIFTEDKELDHFATAHGGGGLILTLFAMLQVVAAIFRPSKPAAGATAQDSSGRTIPAPPSTIRKAWTLLHRILGYVAVIFAVFQCLGGLDQVDDDGTWTLLYLILVIVMLVAFVVLQTLFCCRAKRDQPVDYSRPQQTNQARANTGTSGGGGGA